MTERKLPNGASAPYPDSDSSPPRHRLELRWQGPAMALAYEFFLPLAARTDPIMARYSEAELTVIEGFLAAIAEATVAHREDIERGVSGGGATPGV